MSGTAIAIFTCQQQNSHPFQERHISVTEPIKVGRSVARARPAPNNAIFDCKVLSRNHALLWYENGTFYLQDTKSSNGTFVNSQRLSKGAEESAPHEIYSGDMVQFGVDVMENSRRVTHGCIVATIQLLHPDGTEAKSVHSNSMMPSAGGSAVQAQEVYLLAQYLQEALHREQMLENKLATLQRLVQNTQSASERGWQALIDEDRLLSRLEVLENQLQAYSKHQTEETLRQELVALQDDKQKYETTAKESLRKVLQEKLDAVTKLSELERSLSNSEDECCHLKETCEASQKELQLLAEKHQEQLTEVAQLTQKLQEAEKHHLEEVEEVSARKVELESRLEDMLKQEDALTAKVEALQADNDFTKEQLVSMKARMDSLKEQGTVIPEISSQGVQVDLINLMDLKLIMNGSESETESESEEIKTENGKSAKARQDICENEKQDSGSESKTELMKENEANLEDLDDTKVASQSEDTSQLDNQQVLRVVHVGCSSPPPPPYDNHLEEKLRDTQQQIESYKVQLKESDRKLNDSRLEIEKLQSQLTQAQKEADTHLSKITSLEAQLNESRKQSENSQELTRHLREEISRLEGELDRSRSATPDVEAPITATQTADLSSAPSPGSPQPKSLTTSHQEIQRLTDLLQKAKDLQAKMEAEAQKTKVELEEAVKQSRQFSAEVKQLQGELMQSKGNTVTNLQDQLQKAECTTKEVKQQILMLREQLKEAQQAAKQSKNEAEQLRVRLEVVQEELEKERMRVSVTPSTDSQKQAAQDYNRAEFGALKEECANLRRRIQDIETEMRLSRHENAELKNEYSRLQASYRELEELRDNLLHKESTWQHNLTDAEKKAHGTQSELEEASERISRLQKDCDEYQTEISDLKTTMESVDEEYQAMLLRGRTVSLCSMIPLVILLFAVVMAFYPVLSQFTATGSPH